jgi:hypothetical protein
MFPWQRTTAEVGTDGRGEEIYFAETFHATGITNNHQVKSHGPLTIQHSNSNNITATR